MFIWQPGTGVIVEQNAVVIESFGLSKIDLTLRQLDTV